jgi:DNA-binding CsgD family transcriptional regulator
MVLYSKATGNYTEAAKNLELQMKYKDSLYNVDKLYNLQMVEKQFANYKQKEALKDAQNEIKIKKKLNYFYIGLSLISLIGLVFMFRSYNFKQKNYIKEKALLIKENEQAQLLTKFNQEKAINAIMEKEIAEQDRQIAIQERLLTEQQKEKLQQELMSNRLQLETKNNFLKEIKEKLPALQKTYQTEIKNISRTVDKSLEADEEFELLQRNFANSNPRFFASLQLKAAEALTQLDLKYCGYIKLGMSTKEIANLMHIEPKSMRMARYRIKQKLQLDKEEDLDNFIIAS